MTVTSGASVDALIEAAKPSASVVLVDPPTAERWLGRNTKNRRIRPRVVAAYAQDMARGDWQITGEAIKFSDSGVLLDGQHRLMAVIESGVTIPMFVVRGLQPEAQDVMDTGSRRVASDALSLAGHENSQLLAASAKWCLLYDAGRLYTDRRTRDASHSEILEYVTDNEELLAAVRFASGVKKHVDLQPSILATAMYLTLRVDRGDSLQFFSRVADGVGLTEGSPVLALRSRLRQIKNDRARIEPEALLSMVIRAWNAWREGRRMASVPIYRGKSSIRCPEPK